MTPEEAIQPVSDKQHLVVIIDDLPSNLLYFNEALNGFGYRTITAENGKKGLEKINAMLPDLILTDVNMPEMDGYGLCEAVKANPATRDIPIVLVTAQDDRDSLIRGLKIGADDFLIKPVKLSELEARARNLLLVKDYRDHMKSYTADLETQVSLRTQELKHAFQELKTVNLQLKESILDTVRRLSTAAEYRDRQTAAHIWRMSHFAQVIAEGMGMPEEFMDNMLYASPMHDVGKIGTPDHILMKEGKLTPEEKEIMAEHTTNGERILSGSDHPLLVMAREIAGSHHEWWDGNGYPRRLKGDDIPLDARIATVADVYDALTTERVYKKAWTPEEAFAHIQSESGTHFDPACVEALNKSRDMILEIQHSQRHLEHVA
ncbi:MAG: response regulator [Fidelibacterota bacterium]|nr:MAG: response regulator [Candidatus Neomarinimicrobiota bacterium]